jgi:TolB protein
MTATRRLFFAKPLAGIRAGLAAVLIGVLAPTAAQAQFRVDISGIGATRVPIAVAGFKDEARSAEPLAAIIRADLERSGAFNIVDAGTTPLDEVSRPVFADWRSLNVDALVSGSVTALADGRLDVRYKLWDVIHGEDKGGQSLAVPAGDLRLSAHRIADAIYQKMTGEPGVFATRIAYVTREGKRHSLRIADADGLGGQVALASPQPIISPAWSPNGKSLAYVSFETGKAVVWVQDVTTGTRRPIADFRGSNSAPAWSPDGKQLAVALSRDGPTQLYLIGADGQNVRRLTNNSAIDTEPVFAADGATLYFVSDRGGGPQIYRLTLASGAAERVTFNGSYNISPTLASDGRTLAYVNRDGNNFRIMALDLASGDVHPVSDTSMDEHPSFSPNGRLLVFTSRVRGRGQLMTSTLDGKIRTRLPTADIDLREPSWGPFGR